MSTMTRQLLPALRALLVLTVLLGIGYPMAITAVAMSVPAQAHGSLIRINGEVVGSSLLAQAAPGPQWFQARPSASEWSGETSGGSNLGPNEPDLAGSVAQRRAELTTANPDAVGPVPGDALTASSSGLDPHISPAYAAWQAPRVAAARGIPIGEVESLIAAHTQDAALGILGASRVNVTDLNAALAARAAK